MFNKTITLFNCKEIEDSKIWYATTINNVDLQATESSNKTMQGTSNGDTVSLIINCDKSGYIKTKTGKKQYLKPKQYQNSENSQNYFTFNPESDFFIEGEWEESNKTSEDDYKNGFYHYMNDTYDSVYKITSAEKFDLLPHFEIGGK